MNQTNRESGGTLGTFSGVFTPSILTILGIILFLRMGYVVGSAGAGRVLVIIGLANIISILTTFSLSATATNLKVKGGGDYYLISRTLGLEFGGAIGLVLFLAQSVSIAFYCIGFGEALVGILPGQSFFSANVIAALAVLFLFTFAWMGADWATKFQYVVMALLIGSIVSFFIGGVPKWESTTFIHNWQAPAGGPGFWILFALFFPAVTGFTQGVSMSGDLRDPGKSLPMGTFMAVGLSMFVYLAVSVVYSGVLPNQTLVDDYHAMKKVAQFGFLIDAGVIAATLSSAMASFLGAPRILQSLSADRIFLFLTFFAKGEGANSNPRRAVLLAGGIALLTISLGQLNLIAQVVSMFFLISYGLLNYATYFEAKAESPSFRPRFKWFNYRLSLLGFLTCLGVMMAIDIKNGVIAASILVAIYQYLKRSAGPARWADSSRSHHLQRIRENLLAVANEPEHARDWRPQLIAFTNDDERRARLLQFATWIEGKSGLTSAVRILEGTGLKMRKLRKEAEEALRLSIKQAGSSAFALVLTSEDISRNLSIMVQAYGIGPFGVNTVLINWMDQRLRGIPGIGEIEYCRNLKTLYREGCNLIVLSETKDYPEQLEKQSVEDRRIDVWWWGDAASRLMLLLAYLMTRSAAWDRATIRLLVCQNNDLPKMNLDRVRQILEDIRIDAVPELIDVNSTDDIVSQSASAAMTFLPFHLRGYRPTDAFNNSLSRIAGQLPGIAFVIAAEDIDLDAAPEEGAAGDLAAALDTFKDAEKQAVAAEKEADKHNRTKQSLSEKLDALKSDDRGTGDEETIPSVEKELTAASTSAEKARRRALRMRAKADDAAAHLHEMTGGMVE